MNNNAASILDTTNIVSFSISHIARMNADTNITNRIAPRIAFFAFITFGFLVWGMWESNPLTITMNNLTQCPNITTYHQMWRKSDTATLIPRVTPDSVNVSVFHKKMSGAKMEIKTT